MHTLTLYGSYRGHKYKYRQSQLLRTSLHEVHEDIGAHVTAWYMSTKFECIGMLSFPCFMMSSASCLKVV